MASPKILKWTTSTGVNVLYSNSPQLPMVDIRIIFAAGGSRDGQLPGIASMVNALLSQGAHGVSANELAVKFDEVGGQFSSGSARDMAWIDLRTLSQWENLAQSLDLLNIILSKPDFSAIDIDRVKKQMLIGLDNEKQSPGAIARKRFYKELYGDHPYGIAVNGDKKSIKDISKDDIVDFYKKYYVSKNATVAIVGDIDAAAAAMIVESIFVGLPSGKKAPLLPVVNKLQNKSIVRVPFESQQTHVYIGQTGITRASDDYFALMVGNHILGGGALLSILGEEVRVKSGLTYSISSGFIPMLQDGPFIISCQTRQEQSEKTLAIINKVVNDFIKIGPTPTQMENAKKNITGSFPLRFSSNSSIAGYLGSIGFYDLPLTYLDTYNTKIEKVSIAGIKKAFSRLIDTRKMLTVMVGKQK